MKQLLTNCELFDGEQLHSKCSLLVDDDKIVDIVPGNHQPGGVDSVVDLRGNLLAPGLLDLQVNGGGGVLFNDEPTVDTLQRIVAAHRRFGTTAMLPTLISDSATTMQRALTAVNTAIQQRLPGIVGIHLEGPHLNPAFHGVHDARMIRPLDDAAMALLTALNAGCTLITVAPETLTPGVIGQLSNAGLIVFAGHSAATYEQTLEALQAGVSGFTHLFNAMTPLNSREPGMVAAALEDERSFFGIIADGHHVHPAMVRLAISAKARGKAMLVTDAMPSVGSASDAFELCGQVIRTQGGRCLTPDDRLAGSNLGMIDAVRNVVEFGGVDRYEALRMASLYPARAIGLDTSLGSARPGFAANLIELNADFTVVRNWIDGDLQEYPA